MFLKYIFLTIRGSCKHAWATATEIFKVAFWMRKWGALSWKRTWLWANTQHICALDKGPLTPSERSSARPTTTRYKDKQGKTRFKGNSHLKSSQKLASNILFVDLKNPHAASLTCTFHMGCFIFIRVLGRTRKYTYKCAGKLVSLLPEIQSELRSQRFPVEVCWNKTI